MRIRELVAADIDTCVSLLMAAYNGPPWSNQWTKETGRRYLSDFVSGNSFIGLVAVESDEIVGAVFAHRRTWWTNDEIYVDELFVRPDRQGRGCGKMLMAYIERLSEELGLGGATLLTNRYHPAKAFYEKIGYVAAEHVVFMYKEVR